MKPVLIVISALGAVVVLAGCSSPEKPASPDGAVVSGYRHDAYNTRHPESGTIRLLRVDGHAVDDPDAPLRLVPGRHTLLVSCAYSRPWVSVDDPAVSITLDAKTDTAYQLYPFTAGPHGEPACRVEIRRQSSGR